MQGEFVQTKSVERRTFRKIRAATESSYHHNVYVVLLDPHALRDPRVRKTNPKRDPAKPCVYVGMTGLSPEERFQNHKAGIKAARVVQRYGVALHDPGGFDTGFDFGSVLRG